MPLRTHTIGICYGGSIVENCGRNKCKLMSSMISAPKHSKYLYIYIISIKSCSVNESSAGRLHHPRHDDNNNPYRQNYNKNNKAR